MSSSKQIVLAPHPACGVQLKSGDFTEVCIRCSQFLHVYLWDLLLFWLSRNINLTFEGAKAPFWPQGVKWRGLRLFLDIFKVTISEIIPFIICIISTTSCIYVKCFISRFELVLIIQTFYVYLITDVKLYI